MKVAIIGSPSFDSLEYHLKDQLLFENHNAEIFDFHSFLPSKIDFALSLTSMSYVEKKNKNLLRKVLAYEPDLVISVYRHVHPLVVKGIKRNKIKIIHVNPDQLTTLQNQQIFVEPYDVYFSKDPYMVNFMKNKLNLNTKIYSEAFNDRIHKRPEGDSKKLEDDCNIDVLCFGNLYPYRNRMLKVLKDNNLNITLFGHKAKYFDTDLIPNFKNKGIYGEEKAKILNGAKIVFNNFHYAEIESVNNKFFEISGMGAFQICDYKPILHELLPIDPKLISFENINEAVELINYYKDQPKERYEIRNKLMPYFIENHTYKQLIDSIIKQI